MSSFLARTLKALLAIVIVVAIAGAWWLTRRSPTVERGSTRRTPLTRGGALIASVRSEPASYNRYVAAGSSAATELITLLTQARLVRVDRATDELEPWLAERWTSWPDGATYTLTLRPGLRFSDGVPCSSADVLFSFRAAYDDRVHSPLKPGLEVGGRPLDVSAPDPQTVVVRFPAPFAPGLRLLDNLPILPKHKLEAALIGGRFADEWAPARPVTDVAGLGPFVLSEHVSGQRLVFTRNPYYFRRDAAGVALPYLDRLTLAVIPDQNAEALRLQAGEIDLMSNADIRAEDYASFKRLADEGRIRLIDVGVGLDPDFLWFNLTPAHRTAASARWLQRREFRQALSYAADRQAIADTVYLGAAVPIHGPVSPGNNRWYSDASPRYPHDPGRARALLGSIDLLDRNGDGLLEDSSGAPVRFTVLSQAGHLRGRTAAMLEQQLRQVGITVDVVLLDPPGIFRRWMAGDYDAIYFGLQASATDPALNPDFWLSSGDGHFWNPHQPTPSTPWEARIDELMREQAGASDLRQRQRAFAEVQRIIGEELPAIYFVAPKVTLATSTRVDNPAPALQAPQLLWSADTLASSSSPARR